jgi:hypothetical protein
MSFDREAAYSVTKPKPKMPWWFEHIDDLSDVEILPCKFFGYDDMGHEIVKPCSPYQVSVWGVYGTYSPKGSNRRSLRVIDDFDTKGEAQLFYNRLIGHFPHLARRRPWRQPAFHPIPTASSVHL